MPKVYVLTTGTYSDYSIKGIFSTRKKAEEYKAKAREAEGASKDGCWIDTDFNDIEEWTLDEQLKEQLHTRYSVGIYLDTGDVAEKSRESQEFAIPELHVYVAESVPIYKGRGVVRAESHKSAAHALKLAAEARQEWLREHSSVKFAG